MHGENFLHPTLSPPYCQSRYCPWKNHPSWCDINPLIFWFVTLLLCHPLWCSDLSPLWFSDFLSPLLMCTLLWLVTPHWCVTNPLGSLLNLLLTALTLGFSVWFELWKTPNWGNLGLMFVQMGNCGSSMLQFKKFPREDQRIYHLSLCWNLFSDIFFIYMSLCDLVCLIRFKWRQVCQAIFLFCCVYIFCQLQGRDEMSIHFL